MSSFPRKSDPRRAAHLSLSSQIEGQLREAYARQFEAGIATQSSLAEKLGINRSAVHHRLMGRTNMTIETIADMVWALGYEITVKIYDPHNIPGEISTADNAKAKCVHPVAEKPASNVGSIRAANEFQRRSSSIEEFLKSSKSVERQRSETKRSVLEAVCA